MYTVQPIFEYRRSLFVLLLNHVHGTTRPVVQRVDHSTTLSYIGLL